MVEPAAGAYRPQCPAMGLAVDPSGFAPRRAQRQPKPSDPGKSPRIGCGRFPTPSLDFPKAKHVQFSIALYNKPHRMRQCKLHDPYPTHT